MVNEIDEIDEIEEIGPIDEINDQVKKLLRIPQYPQRSEEWFSQRRNAITASDIPTVLGENPYKSAFSLLVDKCGGNPLPFTGNEATRWGNHYEPIAIAKYESLRNKKVLDFGLLIHPEYSWLGGSPDGITTDGILLEVKCPLRRKIIPGQVPKHYLAQILLNMEICNLDHAHFIEYIPGSSDDSYEINIVDVPRDREWFARSLPIMKEFWDSVVKYRALGIKNHPKYSNTSKNSKNSSNSNTGITLDLTSNAPLFIEDSE